MEATNIQMRETKRTDLSHIDPRRIEFVPGFNVRTDMGDIEELMNSIIKIGVKVPLRGFRKGEIFYLTDGHRRLIAVKKAIENGHDIARVPFIIEPKGYSEEDRVIDMITCNDGKNLTQYETAKVFQKLQGWGYAVNEISEKTGKSQGYISNCLSILELPVQVQKSIAEEKISVSAVKSIEKTAASEAEVVEKVQKAVEVSNDAGKKKATVKHIESVDRDKVEISKAVAKLLKVMKAENIKNRQIEALQGFLEDPKCNLKTAVKRAFSKE